jgi:hypothetical protein
MVRHQNTVAADISDPLIADLAVSLAGRNEYVAMESDR